MLSFLFNWTVALLQSRLHITLPPATQWWQMVYQEAAYTEL